MKEPGDLLLREQVLPGTLQELGIIPEMTEADVAQGAQDASNLAGLVIVVYVRPEAEYDLFLADQASASL